MSQLMPLPLTVSCFSKIQTGFTFLVPAHLVVPEKGPLNGCIQLNSRIAGTKNWRILLVRSFTARMPLLTATSAFTFGRIRWSSPQQCYLHCLRTYIIALGYYVTVRIRGYRHTKLCHCPLTVIEEHKHVENTNRKTPSQQPACKCIFTGTSTCSYISVVCSQLNYDRTPLK